MELKDLADLPIKKVVEIKQEINLTEDEEIVFMDTLNRKSRTQIAMKIGMCEKSVTNIRSRINRKLDYLEYMKQFDKGYDAARD